MPLLLALLLAVLRAPLLAHVLAWLLTACSFPRAAPRGTYFVGLWAAAAPFKQAMPAQGVSLRDWFNCWWPLPGAIRATCYGALGQAN